LGNRRYIAFGVEPNQRATYELRQSRYEALATTILHEAHRLAKHSERRLELLDVGVNFGLTRRYLEPRMNGLDVRFHGVDLFPHGTEIVYRWEDWTLHHMDLEQGMPDLPSASYDFVVCEQVLEHLHEIGPTICDMRRVLRPGGLMIVGVPIFPFGLHRLRNKAIALVDRISGPRERGHVQAWSLRSFLHEFTGLDDLHVECARGFRIVSGGIIRPLEFTRRWWRFNRWLGERVPSLCIEVQVLLRRAGEASSACGSFVVGAA
jgi:SAM-dependent methyltransferase